MPDGFYKFVVNNVKVGGACHLGNPRPNGILRSESLMLFPLLCSSFLCFSLPFYPLFLLLSFPPFSSPFSFLLPQELEVLMMSNRRYAAEIARTVSSRKRKQIIERAQQLDIKVLNPNARLRSQENEWRRLFDDQLYYSAPLKCPRWNFLVALCCVPTTHQTQCTSYRRMSIVQHLFLAVWNPIHVFCCKQRMLWANGMVVQLGPLKRWTQSLLEQPSSPQACCQLNHELWSDTIASFLSSS